MLVYFQRNKWNFQAVPEGHGTRFNGVRDGKGTLPKGKETLFWNLAAAYSDGTGRNIEEIRRPGVLKQGSSSIATG